jgi:hypothetical protein
MGALLNRRCVPLVDPIVTLWAKTQPVNAELNQASAQHGALRDLISGRRPGQPQGVSWAEWHCDDPDLTRITATLDRSDKLCGLSSDLYNEIAVAVATTPAGVRAKAAAALSIWVQEKRLQEEMWCYDLIHNALREAAAGSAS